MSHDELCPGSMGPDARYFGPCICDRLMLARSETPNPRSAAVDVPRWTLADPSRMSVVPAQEGDLVTYADHVAAVEAATLTSLSGSAAVRTSEPEPPTSVAPAGEDHGAHNAALTPWDMRVLVEMLQSARALVESEDFDGFALGRATGRAEARDAAAAVEPLYDPFPIFPQGPVVYRHHILAAIAALWGAE